MKVENQIERKKILTENNFTNMLNNHLFKLIIRSKYDMDRFEKTKK